MVAKEAAIWPMGAWPGIPDLNLPPNSRVPFFYREKITMPALLLFIISMRVHAYRCILDRVECTVA